jgi:hypothetical protein
VHGLAAVISVGDAVVKAAKVATTEAGHAASSVVGTAAHGASTVAKPFGSIVDEAKAEAHVGGKKKTAPRPARRKKPAAS